MKAWITDRIVLRYFVLFLAFSMLLLSLYIPVYRYIDDFTHRSVLERITRQMESGIATLDTTVTALNNAVVTTNSDARFRNFRYESMQDALNPLALVALRQTLAGLMMPQGLIADAGILFRADLVLTTRRSFYSDTYYTFYPDYVSCQQLSFDAWRSFLLSGGSFLPAMQYRTNDYGTYDALTYARRWSATGAYTESLFFATLPVDWLLPLLVEADVLRHGYVLLTSSSGEPLLAHGTQDGDFHLITAQAGLNQINIEVGIPTSFLRAQLIPVQRLMLLFAAVALALTLLLTLLFSYRGAEPMRRMLGRVTTTQHVRRLYDAHQRTGPCKSRFPKLYKPYDDLASCIEQIDEQIDAYQSTIDRQKELICIQMMERALQRGLYGKGELAEFNVAFSTFPEVYQLAAWYYDLAQFGTMDENATFQYKLVTLLHRLLPGSYAQGMDGNTVITVLPIAGEKQWAQELLTLCGDLAAQFDLAIQYAVSDVFSSPEDLVRAYQQLQYSVASPQHRHLTGAGLAKSTLMEKTQLPFSMGEMQVMYCALSSGNEEVALATLESCRNALVWEDYATVKHTFSMIAHLLAQLKLETPSVLFEVIIPTLTIENHRDMFDRLLPACFAHICACIAGERQHRTDTFAMDVLAYVNENIYDQELYISSVSRYFEISAPTLQKIIKAETGQTFSSYVEEKRLGKAYQLLSEGGQSVGEVSHACGFTNTNSFYKAFKRKYGVSPTALQ